MEERLADLVAAVADRDGDALHRLHDRLSGEVFAVAYVRLGDADAAEDVRQETFLRIWRSAGSFRATAAEDGGVRAWVLAIARNAAIDRRRRLRREVLVADLPEPRRRTPLDVEALAAGLDLRALLESLPRTLRDPVLLHVLAGLPVRDCAERLHASPATVKRRCREGLDRLGRRIERERRLDLLTEKDG